MTARDAATQYIALGWQVVPLEPQGKKCVDTDWLTHVYTPQDFSPTSNIGIKSLGGLVDVDCDCAEAVAMADAFLPHTGAIYGRPSRPRSHWLFRCADIKDPVSHKDLIEKRTIIEIRVNHQSMAPPSTHPEGEVVAWSTPTPKELTVDKTLLIRAVQLTATASLIAKHYNAPGDRHDWGIALAGLLRRLSVTQHEAERMFDHAAKWARDEKVKDRFDAIRTTYSLPEDAPMQGGKKLEELTSKDFVASLYKIWGNDNVGISKSRLDQMNEKHAVLFNQAGDLIVMSEELEDGMFQLRFTDPHKMALLYPQLVPVGLSAKGQPIVKPLGLAWLTHPKRRFYRGIELAPNGHSNAGYYNMWRGFSVEPKQGTYPLFREHLMLLANHNTEHARYIYAWLADAVQHPERPGGIALAFKGKQGTGKSTFAKWFGALFGPHFLHLDSEQRLLGHFNAHLHNAIVILADEAVWAGGKIGLGALKRMITEQTLAIERKGMDVINVKNMLHMLIASNEDWIVPVGFDNRRFAVFEISDARRNDWAFFDAVHKELMSGGYAALLYDLLQFKSDIELRNIPVTKELDRQKKQSMTAKHAWWYEVLDDGSLWDEAMKHPAHYELGDPALPFHGPVEDAYEVDGDALFTSLASALKIGDSRVNAGFKASLSRFLATVLPAPFPDNIQHTDGKRGWLLPSRKFSRDYFEQLMGTKWSWAEGVEVQTTVDVPF